MTIALYILMSSVTIQTVNIALAVRLISRTKNHLAGGLVIAVASLMAFRRAISLHRYLTDQGYLLDLTTEFLALVTSLLFFTGILYIARIMESEVRSKREKDEVIGSLQKALAEIKTLKGIVPICASCKKIRDDRGYWNKLEKFFSDHLTAEFSHGICPECAEKLYPHLPLGLQTPENDERKRDG